MNTKLLIALFVLILLVGLCLATLPHVTVFEDGGWRLGIFYGCIRGELCQMGG